jgi:hypothetical protein
MIRPNTASDKYVFVYEAVHKVALKGSLSEERFQTYLDASGGDEDAALCLYTWNTAVAAAFYGPLQACEVTLRNSVNAALAHRYGQWWFRNGQILHNREIAMAREAEETINRLGKTATGGRVVAELNFAFWVSLFAKSYDTALWRTELHRAFSPTPDRRALHENLDRLRTLRNRVAHHEPIFQRHLMDDYDRILDILSRLSPPVAEWVRHHSRVPDIIATAERDTERF